MSDTDAEAAWLVGLCTLVVLIVLAAVIERAIHHPHVTLTVVLVALAVAFLPYLAGRAVFWLDDWWW